MIAPRPRLPVDLETQPKDDGLFGPDSVTWRLMAAPSVGVGIGTAVLMQMLLPGVVRMLNQSSSFKLDPATRGRLTVQYATTTTYGDTAAAERAGELLRNIHGHKQAIDPDTGETYQADRPDLLMWVHTTIVWSALRASEVWGPQLTAAERDRFVDEQRTAARLVGLDPATVPASVAALNEYMKRMAPRLAYTPDARLLVKDAMLGPKPCGSTWIERTVAGAFIELLPPDMYELYGFHRSRWTRRIASLTARILLAIATARFPYDKVLPQLRREAREQAFGGKARGVKRGSEPVPIP